MNKKPQHEGKGRRIATSNKQKRAALEEKRAERRNKVSLKQQSDTIEDAVRKGAVAADTSQQVRSGATEKRQFYVDQPFDCVDCGKHEVWTATQQKWYFEVAKGSIYCRAVRCRTCRQRRRGGSPTDPAAYPHPHGIPRIAANG